MSSGVRQELLARRGYGNFVSFAMRFDQLFRNIPRDL
jgi:hypothetical protein